MNIVTAVCQGPELDDREDTASAPHSLLQEENRPCRSHSDRQADHEEKRNQDGRERKNARAVKKPLCAGTRPRAQLFANQMDRGACADSDSAIRRPPLFSNGIIRLRTTRYRFIKSGITCNSEERLGTQFSLHRVTSFNSTRKGTWPCLLRFS
jgi:hypothetical protein